jgi:hypothetical protein
LELCGFDCQFTARASQEYLLNDIRAVLSKLDQNLIDTASCAVLLAELDVMVKNQKPTDNATHEKRRDLVARFRQALAAPGSNNRLAEAELLFWRQYAKSLAAYVEQTWAWQSSNRQSSQMRNAQMAENLIWLARNAYPHRKIIVWAASSHLIRNPSGVQPPKELRPDSFRDGVTMGDGVWKELGDESYTLAFVAAEGQAGRAGNVPFVLPLLQRGSLEDLLVAAGYENAIVNFRRLDESGAWLRDKLASRPMSYLFSSADWTNVFDGIFFTRTMYPSTLAERAKPPAAPTEQFAEGWTGPKRGTSDYEVGLDTRIMHGGKASAYLKPTTDQPRRFGTLSQRFAADQYRGKRLRMTAFVKSQDVEDRATLSMTVHGKEMTGLVWDNMYARPIKGSNDWKEYAIVLDVPADAAGATEIVFGLYFRGKGQVWVDDFQFETVGQDVATTAMPAQPQKRQDAIAKDLPMEPKNLDFEQ